MREWPGGPESNTLERSIGKRIICGYAGLTPLRSDGYDEVREICVIRGKITREHVNFVNYNKRDVGLPAHCKDLMRDSDGVQCMDQKK